MRLLKYMAEAVPIGLVLFGLMPYRRLIGYSRNDDEAVKYLGWKKPIYYDSDLLLKIPDDIHEATVVTAQPLDLGNYLSLMNNKH